MWGCVRVGPLPRLASFHPLWLLPQPLEEGAHWRALPFDSRIVFAICWGGWECRKAEVEQLAGLWKQLKGELGILPESGSPVLAFLHPSYIPAFCIHLRCLPETFPGETAASLLKEEIFKGPWSIKSWRIDEFLHFDNTVFN